MPPKKKRKSPRLPKGRNVVPITVYVTQDLHGKWVDYVRSQTPEGSSANGSQVFRDLVLKAIAEEAKKNPES